MAPQICINTMPRYVYQSVFKNFAKFFSSPTRSFLLSIRLPAISCTGVAWPLFVSIDSLALWLCGPLALCLFLSLDCLPSGPCVAFWIYLLGSCSLVGGVEWCYPCWDPRFVLLHFVIPFHLFTFYLRPHAMLLVLHVGDRSVFLQGCYWGRGLLY